MNWTFHGLLRIDKPNHHISEYLRLLKMLSSLNLKSTIFLLEFIQKIKTKQKSVPNHLVSRTVHCAQSYSMILTKLP